VGCAVSLSRAPRLVAAVGLACGLQGDFYIDSLFRLIVTLAMALAYVMGIWRRPFVLGWGHEIDRTSSAANTRCQS
jgi:hypothetical protein